MKIGDKVKIIGNDPLKGETGEIVEVDKEVGKDKKTKQRH